MDEGGQVERLRARGDACGWHLGDVRWVVRCGVSISCIAPIPNSFSSLTRRSLRSSNRALLIFWRRHASSYIQLQMDRFEDRRERRRRDFYGAEMTFLRDQQRLHEQQDYESDDEYNGGEGGDYRHDDEDDGDDRINADDDNVEEEEEEEEEEEAGRRGRSAALRRLGDGSSSDEDDDDEVEDV